MKKIILYMIVFVVNFFYTEAQERIPIESSETYLGFKAKGSMTIIYAAINPGDDNLRRPLIVVEGFDPGHITKPELATGESNIDQFLRDAPSSPCLCLKQDTAISNTSLSANFRFARALKDALDAKPADTSAGVTRSTGERSTNIC